MSFSWPYVLLSLLLLPILVAGYLWAGRRRRRQAVTYSSLTLIKLARPASSAWRRHIPFALMLGALGCLGLAGARPQFSSVVPVSASSVIVAVDVSGSMCSTDVSPNRLSAAQSAVRKFVQSQNSHTRIGLVAFSSFAELTVAPTTRHDDLLHAIDSLTTGRGTVIGSAILKSVDAISAIDPNVAPADDGSGVGTGPNGVPDGGTNGGSSGQVPSAHRGSYAPEIVVLLTDGANTRGITPIDAAKIAAARGVRVYPIGFGTTHPMPMVCTADQLGGDSFGNFGPPGGTNNGYVPGPGGTNFLSVDVPTLQQVASLTGGAYFSASDANQLQNVLHNLPRHVKVQRQEMEVSVVLAGLAALLILLAVGAAVRWSTFPA